MAFLLIVSIIVLLIVLLKFNSRISLIEGKLRELSAGAIKQPTTSSVPLRQESVVQTTKIPTQDLRQKIVENKNAVPTSNVPAGVSTGVGAQKPVTSVPVGKVMPLSIKPVVSSQQQKKNYEFQFGGNILTIIGSVAVIIGVGFFLRYAFVNGLISESMRVVMGLLAGLALIILGDFLRKKYAVYGQLLTGSGVGILYLSTYAAWNFYQLVPVSFVFIGFLVVTCVGIFLASRANSKILAGLSQFGGFLTPILLSSNNSNDHLLLIYVILLSVGFLAVAYLKKWRVFMYSSFVSATVLFAIWLSYYTVDKLFITEFYAIIIFLLFIGVSVINYLKKLTPQDGFDLALATLVPLNYLMINNKILEPYQLWFNIFLFGLAAIYLAISVYLPGSDNISARFRLFMAGVSTLLFILLIPSIFNGSLITIAWATEAAILIFCGLKINSRTVRLFGHGVFFISFIRLLFVDLHTVVTYPVFNLRTLTFLLVVLAFAFAVWAYEKYKSSFVGKSYQIETSYLLLAASLALIVGGSKDIQQFYNQQTLMVFWSIIFLALAGTALVLRNTALRIFAMIFSFITFVTIFVEEMVVTGLPVANDRFLAYVGFIIACSVVLQLISKKREGLLPNEYPIVMSVIFLQVYVISLRWIGVEVKDFFTHVPLFGFTAYSLLAVVGIYVGLRFKNIALRFAVYATYILLSFFLMAKSFDVILPFINERAYSALAVAVSIGIAVLLTHIYENELKQEIAVFKSVLLLDGYFILAWLIGVEIGQFFFDHNIFNFVAYSLLALAGGLGALKLKNTPLRVVVYITFGLLMFTNFFSIWSSDISNLLVNERVGGVLVVVICAYLFKLLLEKSQAVFSKGERKLINTILFFGSNLILWSLMNREIMDYFGKNSSRSESGVISLKDIFISIGWTVYGLVLLMLGIFKRSSMYRLSAIFLLGIGILKVFIYDALSLNDLYRFMSFISLGLILLLAGFLYYRYRERIMQFIEVKEG